MLGTPPEDRQPGRGVPMHAETPDLVSDLEEIQEEFDGEGRVGTAVDWLNKLAEFGWQIVRHPDVDR